MTGPGSAARKLGSRAFGLLGILLTGMRNGFGRFPRLRVGLVSQAYDQGPAMVMPALRAWSTVGVRNLGHTLNPNAKLSFSDAVS